MSFDKLLSSTNIASPLLEATRLSYSEDSRMSMTIAVAAARNERLVCTSNMYKGLSLSVENIASFFETRNENKYVIYRAPSRFTALVRRYSPCVVSRSLRRPGEENRSSAIVCFTFLTFIS